MSLGKVSSERPSRRHFRPYFWHIFWLTLFCLRHGAFSIFGSDHDKAKSFFKPVNKRWNYILKTSWELLEQMLYKRFVCFFGWFHFFSSIIKDVLTWRDLVSKICISSNWHLYIVKNMSRSRSRILLDPVFKGGGEASPKGKWIG